MVKKLNPFCKLIRAVLEINIKSEHEELSDSVDKAISDAFELALKKPLPGKQLVVMTDTSLWIAGYDLMIENIADKKIQSERKMHEHVAFGSRKFSSTQLVGSI